MASKEEIKRQIEALQVKLAEAPETPPAKRRRTNQGNVLAPSTPSPRKKAVAHQKPQTPANPIQETRRMQALVHPQAPKPNHASNICLKYSKSMPDSAPSAFLSQLKSLSASNNNNHESVARTEGFEEKPTLPASVPMRDDRLAIVEDLVPGPVEHKPIADDPAFERIEPNSGIKLKDRVLPHTSLQDHLSGRYFLPPSLLYSIVRLQPNKQAYEVPVEGDWVTIAVVAERGDVKLTSGPGNAAHGKRPGDENDDDRKDSKESKKRRKKGEDEEDEDSGRKGGKKYVHLKLVDLGHRSRSSTSSSDSPRGSLRGDAQLSLLLFESDYYDKLIERNGKQEKVRKLWRGGSGGAFEECFPRLREGTVIALLNPKVLKPFTNSKNPSSPTSSILALTPPTASAIAVIGYAADLGRCTVLKRDGKPCGSWVDRRINGGGVNSKHAEDVCDYHVQTAVQRARAGRSEFSIGTSGMSTTARKGKPAYDPAHQWGLKPEAGSRGPDGEATYVIGGFVASSSRTQTLGNVSNTMGRDEQARARRKAGAHEDKALAELLGKGNSAACGVSGGASREALTVVQRAREALSEAKERESANQKAEDKAKHTTTVVEDDENQPRRKAFSAEMVKRLGFDPTIKAYGTGKGKSKNLDAVSKFGRSGNQHREIRLGPPPGPKVRSGVIVAHLSTENTTVPTIESALTEPRTDADDRTPNESELHHSLKLWDTGLKMKAGIRCPFRLEDGVESDSDSDLEIEPPGPSALAEVTAENQT